MVSPSMEEDDHSSPSDDQKLFVVLAVAIATICFLTNAILALIFICHHHLNNTKNVLFLSQSVAGLFTTFTIIYPIKLISIRLLEDDQSNTLLPPSDLEFFSNYSSCYLLSSGLLLLCMFSTFANNLLLAFEQYVIVVQPPRFQALQLHNGLWNALVVGVWIQALALALIPWSGLNNWLNFCYVPSIWTTPFTGVMAFLLCLHIIGFIYVNVGVFIRSRAGIEPLTETEELPICDNPSSTPLTGTSYEPTPRVNTTEAKARFINFLVILLCYLPLTLHLLTRADKHFTANELASVAEQDFILPWASLLVVLCGVLSPLVYIFTDDDLSNATIQFLKSLCCCQWMRRNNAISPNLEAE